MQGAWCFIHSRWPAAPESVHSWWPAAPESVHAWGQQHPKPSVPGGRQHPKPSIPGAGSTRSHPFLAASCSAPAPPGPGPQPRSGHRPQRLRQPRPLPSPQAPAAPLLWRACLPRYAWPGPECCLLGFSLPTPLRPESGVLKSKIYFFFFLNNSQLLVIERFFLVSKCCSSTLFFRWHELNAHLLPAAWPCPLQRLVCSPPKDIHEQWRNFLLRNNCSVNSTVAILELKVILSLTGFFTEKGQ